MAQSHEVGPAYASSSTSGARGPRMDRIPGRLGQVPDHIVGSRPARLPVGLPSHLDQAIYRPATVARIGDRLAELNARSTHNTITHATLGLAADWR